MMLTDAVAEPPALVARTVRLPEVKVTPLMVPLMTPVDVSNESPLKSDAQE